MSSIFNSAVEATPSSGAFTGYNVIIQILEEDIAKAERLTIDVSNNIKQQYVVGNRTPLNIETGLLIRGTIRMLYINTGLLRLVLGNEPELIPQHGTSIGRSTVSNWMGDPDLITPAFADPKTYFRLPEMTISCMYTQRDDDTTDMTHSINLLGVKFDRFSISIDANDVILQDVEFFAERLKPVMP